MRREYTVGTICGMLRGPPAGPGQPNQVDRQVVCLPPTGRVRSADKPRGQRRRGVVADARCSSTDRGSSIPAARLLRVLVVDDCQDQTETSSILLELWGHDVRIAHSGGAALDAVTAFRPDVFLVDIGMPGMSGYELGRRLRPLFEEALLVAVTGYAEALHRLLGEEAGFDLYLAKPADPSILETLLALELSRLTRVPAEATRGAEECAVGRSARR